MPFPSAPKFTQRVPLQFFCPDNPTLNITGSTVLINNPVSYTVNTGTIGKVDAQLNGVPVYRGTGELPPFSIDMQWKVLGMNDYMKLAALVPYFVHMVSFRNFGYFGKLILSGPDSQGAQTADTVQAKALFMPITPSDYGSAQAVNRLTVPTLTVNTRGANTGYIPSTSPLYYWLTFSTDYGETSPSPVVSKTPLAQDSCSLSWTWPTTTAYCTQASVYVSTVNDPTTSKLKAEVPNGLTPTFIDYTATAGTTVNQQPPTSNTAYRGAWLGGIFFNELP
jgi:hypothetical protein